MEVKVNAAGRRKFSPELKLQIIKQAQDSEQSVSVVAREYDVNANQVFRWMREMEKGKARWVRVINGQCQTPKAQTVSTFLPVAASSPAKLTKSITPCITVELTSGHRLSIENANTDLLQTLLTTLT